MSNDYNKQTIYAADFETTVYKGQNRTDVWSACMGKLFSNDPLTIDHSIDDFFERIFTLPGNLVIYFHNLKFDGSFILDWILNNPKFKLAADPVDDREQELAISWKKNKVMYENTYKYAISDRGMWYTITMKQNRRFIEFRDSLKLMPFKLSEIADAFKTEHKKLDMKYEGFRYPGCKITEQEEEYIKNDVYVLKEALEIMISDGHNKLTIGSCCYAEYREICGKSFYYLFTDQYKVNIPYEKYGAHTAGDYVHASYKGGWCYLVKGKEEKIFGKGLTADVNSLYPSMMSSESGNRYPVGNPTFWKGNYLSENALKNNRYYFIRIKTRFYLKPGYLPFIQIKGSHLYTPTECLESSDVYDRASGEKGAFYTGLDGKIHDTRVELTLTCTDYELFREHYYVYDFEILDGCYYETRIGLFDDYIEKYKKIKLESKGAKRTLAKLYLNNLYGKFASNTDSSFKVAYLKNGALAFYPVDEHLKHPGYIPVGSAITSYARNFTIRAAQRNYHGVDKPGFIYADTDSIHCDLPVDEVKGLPVHEKNFCCWKIESYWDKAIFTRQKTYIEHITHEDGEPVDHPYNNIKCAGMPENCKDLLDKSITGVYNLDEIEDKEQMDFVQVKRTYKDFRVGLRVPGKLRPVRIPGGTLLMNDYYTMH